MDLRIDMKLDGPARALADAELHFLDGPLQGLKLVGFTLVNDEHRGPRVRMPGRAYNVHGERRYLDLLRPIEEGNDAALTWLVDEIVQTYQMLAPEGAGAGGSRTFSRGERS